VINSQGLGRSPAMRSFLLYITEHAISGSTERLKEQTIGAEVLGRKSNYDPADDNIVRVRAHELRGRLEKYFASEGIDEPVIITIPKGSYIPEFALRKVASTDASASSHGGEESASHIPQEKQDARRLWAFVATLLLTVLITAFVTARFIPRPDPRAATVLPGGAVHDFWGQFFDKPGEELRIVYADTGFALWQDLGGKTLNLGDYLSHKYIGTQEDKLAEVAIRRSTSPADLSISLRVVSLAAQFGGRVSSQFARNASADFFDHGNVLLIGSHRSNPWVEMFERSLNFQVEQDPHSGAPLFRNRAPLPNEAAAYAIPKMLDTEGTEQREFVSYGLVALLKGCGDRGLIVLNEGLNMEATQAAGDAVLEPKQLDSLLRSIGHNFGTNVTPFEALIQITSLPGGYNGLKVIAYRLRSAESCVGN